MREFRIQTAHPFQTSEQNLKITPSLGPILVGVILNNQGIIHTY